MERTSRRLKFVEMERWYIFHDGCHNWDKYWHPHDTKYTLRKCVRCGNIIKEDLEEFYSQGTVCIKACKCEEEE